MLKRLPATHHARWMGTCLYLLNIVICSDFFKVGAQQLADMLVLCFYIIYVHYWYWMSCPVMADAPFLILNLHRDLTAWKARDSRGAKAGLRKVDLHTEYLSGRSVVLALASDKLSDEEKDAMAAKLRMISTDSHVEMGKPEMPRIYEDSVMSDFVDESSWLFFRVNLQDLEYGVVDKKKAQFHNCTQFFFTALQTRTLIPRQTRV